MLDFLIDAALNSFLLIIYFFGLIILFGLILGLIERSLIRFSSLFLSRSIIYVTALIGVPVHELSHALIAKIFAHKIKSISLLKFNKRSKELGSVRLSYNNKSLYQNIGLFFIGIAPIFIPLLLIYLLMYLLIPNIFSFIMSSSFYLNIFNLSSLIEDTRNLFSHFYNLNNFLNWRYLSFLFIALSISSHMSLSYLDVKHSFKGLLLIFLIMFFINIFLLLFKIDLSLASSFLHEPLFISLLFLTLSFSLLIYLISFLLYNIAKIFK